ncbi:MAG TPA: YceI family protein [Blastocatellia bacterium]|nr:YceI family protein [Blastocatellia bacterium]
MRYRVDASRSQFIAQAFAKGLLSAFGHNPSLAIRSFGGEAEFDPAAPNAAWARMIARASSLVVIDEMSEKDRHEIERVTREELLETSRYAEIVFRSAGVASRRVSEDRYQVRITGDLSLRGVSRELAIVAMATFEGDELRAQGGFRLRLTDFNIRPVSVAGGLLKLKDEVQLSFDILARASSASMNASP